MPNFSLGDPLSIQTYGSIVPSVPIEETLSALTSGKSRVRCLLFPIPPSNVTHQQAPDNIEVHRLSIHINRPSQAYIRA